MITHLHLHVHLGQHPVTDTCSSACGRIDGNQVSGSAVKQSTVMHPTSTVCSACLDTTVTGDARHCSETLVTS